MPFPNLTVPDTPREAQDLLFMVLGAAVAEAQAAEVHASSVYRMLKGEDPPPRSTLGQKANAMSSAFPEPLRSQYQEMVSKRNYLVHEVLSDCGGWSGIPFFDSPKLFSCLCASIQECREAIELATNALNEHLIDDGQPMAVVAFTEDGLETYDRTASSWIPVTSPTASAEPKPSDETEPNHVSQGRS